MVVRLGGCRPKLKKSPEILATAQREVVVLELELSGGHESLKPRGSGDVAGEEQGPSHESGVGGPFCLGDESS